MKKALLFLVAFAIVHTLFAGVTVEQELLFLILVVLLFRPVGQKPGHPSGRSY